MPLSVVYYAQNTMHIPPSGKGRWLCVYFKWYAVDVILKILSFLQNVDLTGSSTKEDAWHSVRIEFDTMNQRTTVIVLVGVAIHGNLLLEATRSQRSLVMHWLELHHLMN